MLFSRKEKGESHTALFVIGSTEVSGAFLHITKEEKPRVLFVHSERIQPALQFEPERFTKNILSALMQCAMQLQAKGLTAAKEISGTQFKPDTFLLSFMAPWYLSQVQVLHVSLEKEKTITHKVLKGIIADEIPHAIKRALAQAPGLSESVEGVEQSVVQTKLNGYVSHNPLGKAAKDIELTVYLSFIDTAFKKHVEDIVAQVFYPTECVLHTSQLTTYLAVRDLFESSQGGLIIEFLGEVTAVSVIDDEVLLDCTSFPIGAHHIIRSVAKRTNLSVEQAAAQLLLLEQGKLTDSTDEAKKLKEALSSVQSIWSDALDTALLSLTSGAPISKVAYVSCEAQWFNWLSETLTDYSSKTPGMSEGIFTTIPLDREKLRTHVDFANGSVHAKIALSALRRKKETVDNILTAS